MKNKKMCFDHIKWSIGDLGSQIYKNHDFCDFWFESACWQTLCFGLYGS